MTRTYTVLPGFDWVAGRPTPDDRRVTLSDVDAAFDLEQGRIEPDTGDAPAEDIAAEPTLASG